VKGIFRFETGIKVNEFRDLRANPRCLIESQVLSFRVKWSRMLGTGVLGSTSQRRVNVTTSTPPPFIVRTATPLSSVNAAQAPPVNPSTAATNSALGINFDPYDHTPLPSRIISTGAAANFPSISNLVGDVFNAPVFVPSTQVDSAQVIPHRNTPVTGFPGRAALGGAYVARWIWSRESASDNLSSGTVGATGRGLGVFEDEMRRLLQKRWVATGGVPLRTHVGPVPAGLAASTSTMSGGGISGVTLTVSSGLGGGGPNSGASTPFGSRSGVGVALIEVDEEDLDRGPTSPTNNDDIPFDIMGTLGLQHDPTVIGVHSPQGFEPAVSSASSPLYDTLTRRMRTQTGSTIDTLSSSTSSLHAYGASTVYTTPDISSLSMSMSGLGISLSPGTGSGITLNEKTTPGGGMFTGPIIGSNSVAGAGSSAPVNPTPLTPVVALPTSDGETQIGWAKVAEPDSDAFLTYASIVPEYCRLEGLLVKGLV